MYAAVTLFNAGFGSKSRDMFDEFQARFNEWDVEMKNADPDINEQAAALAMLLPASE